MTELLPIRLSVDRENLKRARQVFDTLDVAESTREDYRRRIVKFLRHARKAGLDRNTFLDYKRALADKTDIAVATKNKYLTAARVFLRELYRLGYIPADLTANVKGFSQSRRHKRFGITDDEMKAITERIRSLPLSPESARLRAILCLLGLQGLRQIEVTRLDVCDLDLAHKTAMVQGKGQDDKELVDLHPETVRSLQEFLETNRIADGPLFVGRSNNSRRLTTRGLRLIIGHILKELEIDKTIHGFRHYFVTCLIRAYAGDLLTVAQYSRHRSLEMLQVYNDNIKRQDDLPRFYKTFESVKFTDKTDSTSHN